MDLEKAYSILSQKLEGWLEKLINLLPNLLLASIILVCGLLLAKFLKNFFRKGVEKLIYHRNLSNLLTSVFYLFLTGIVLFTALSVLQLNKAVTTLLAGAGILSLGFAFAFQDIAANFVSGVFITLQKPFTAGETIESKGHFGTVEIVNLRDTVIRTVQGQVVRIPNKDIFQNPLINYTRLGKRRLDLEIGVSYSDDLEKAEAITLEAVQQISVIQKDEPVKVLYKSFGDSSIMLSVQVWLNSGEQKVYLQAQSEAVKLIKAAYNANGIRIPFPIRSLDFEINGREKFSELLQRNSS